MTEKRFSVKQRQGATNYSINDYYGELPLSEGIYYKSNANKLCKWLNTQHELLNTLYKENEQLKSDLDYFKAKNSSLENGMFNLERENEKLKSEINMLKVTIGRNEGYIDRLTHKGEWR